MAQAIGQQRHNRQVRLPAGLEGPAEWQLRLPPFAGHVNGWAGSINELLAGVSDGTLLLACVPLVSVVDQYVSYIKGLDLDEAGELLDLAASLIQWKSRLMLPCDPLLADAGGDPRQQIMRDLRAGEQKRRNGKTAQGNAAEQNQIVKNPEELSLLDLFVLLNEVEQTLSADSSYQIAASPVTVADQLQWLSQWFTDHKVAAVSSDLLFLLHSSDGAKICLFLALLEMVKRGQLWFNQKAAFNAIIIHPVKE